MFYYYSSNVIFKIKLVIAYQIVSIALILNYSSWMEDLQLLIDFLSVASSLNVGGV